MCTISGPSSQRFYQHTGPPHWCEAPFTSLSSSFSEIWWQNGGLKLVRNERIICEYHNAFTSKWWIWNVFHFEILHGTFLFVHIHKEPFSVISERCFMLLVRLRPLIPIWPRNWYKVPDTNPLAPISTALTVTLYPSFSSSALRSSYLLVLYVWLSSIWLSYGIVNPTTMISGPPQLGGPWPLQFLKMY